MSFSSLRSFGSFASSAIARILPCPRKTVPNRAARVRTTMEGRSPSSLHTVVAHMAGPYSSTIAEITPRPDGRFDITIEGPGLLNPLLLVVVSSAEADAFVQVLNFAYTQGVLSQQRTRKKA